MSGKPVFPLENKFKIKPVFLTLCGHRPPFNRESTSQKKKDNARMRCASESTALRRDLGAGFNPA